VLPIVDLRCKIILAIQTLVNGNNYSRDNEDSQIQAQGNKLPSSEAPICDFQLNDDDLKAWNVGVVRSYVNASEHKSLQRVCSFKH
jgi:hypothetical protein